MTNEMKEQDPQDSPIVINRDDVGVGPAAQQTVAVFTTAFLQLLEVNQNHAVISLAPAIQLLIDLNMLSVFCPDARPNLRPQPTGEVGFQAEPYQACLNGNVQINCE